MFLFGSDTAPIRKFPSYKHINSTFCCRSAHDSTLPLKRPGSTVALIERERLASWICAYNCSPYLWTDVGLHHLGAQFGKDQCPSGLGSGAPRSMRSKDSVNNKAEGVMRVQRVPAYPSRLFDGSSKKTLRTQEKTGISLAKLGFDALT